MSIKIIEGVPGAGKTYYGIKHIVDKYFDIIEGQLTLKSNTIIITNIDEFTGEHSCLKKHIKEAGGVKNFFSNTNQEKMFRDLGPIIYVIDEAQMIFDRKFYDRDVFAWFEYHRHYGQNIYLITQSASKLPKDITSLVEYTIRALPRSRSITGKEFRYNHVSGKDILKRDIIPIKKQYFNFYKSADAAEVETVKNPFLGRIGIYLSLIIIFFSISVYSIKKSWSKSSPPSTAITSSSTLQKNNQIYDQNPKEFLQSNEELIKQITFSYVYKLNYLGTFGRNKSTCKILFNGSIIPISDFPYHIEVSGTDLLAIIPELEFEFLFDELPPQRKWHKRIENNV